MNSEPPAKRGAGLLLCCRGDVLLLLRNSRHNDRTWGLPGGNCDPEDTSLQATAVREAREELGLLPPLAVARECLTRRGKLNDKLYTVFVCQVEPAVRVTWTPTLNEEHWEHCWFSAATVARAALSGEPPLHPVVTALALQYPGVLEEVACFAAA